MRRTGVVIAMAVANVSSFGPAEGRAQADSLPNAAAIPAALCWRGKPLPKCRSFWLTEMSGEYTYADT